MKASTLHEVKKELQLLSAPDLVELSLALAKYKKDNKEFLSYLLFRSHDKTVFVNEIKEEIDEYFAEINNQNNLYFAKKSLRKIVRVINKYSKYINDKALSADLYIYFCKKLRSSNIAFRKSQQLVNLYGQLIKKINTLISTLHEDLQSDYQEDLESISL